MNYKKELYDKLDSSKIEIAQNKNPIRMELFMSFLKVPVVKIKDCLGSSTGWTRYENEEIGLVICGGRVRGVEYLDSIQYKKNPSNKYNNYVNPFFIFDVLTNEGRKFFANYYETEILKIISDTKSALESAMKNAITLNDLYNGLVKETNEIFKSHLTDNVYEKYEK